MDVSTATTLRYVLLALLAGCAVYGIWHASKKVTRKPSTARTTTMIVAACLAACVFAMTMVIQRGDGMEDNTAEVADSFETADTP